MLTRIFSFFIVYCVMLSAFSFGQNPTIDSLNKVILNASHDTTRLAAMNELASELSNVDPDSSISISLKVIKLSSALLSNSDPTSGTWLAAMIRKGAAEHHLGMYYSDQGNYVGALEKYQQAMSTWEKILAHSLSNKLKIRQRRATTLGNIGNTYYNLSNYTTALNYYYQALAIDEELKNKEGIARHYGNIGNLYMSREDFDKAREWYEKALNINTELNYKYGVAAMLTSIGNIYSETKKYQQALDYYFKALKLDEEEQSNADISIDLGNIGIVYWETGEYDKALEYYDRALKISELLGDKNSIAAQTGNVGSLYLAQKKYAKAEPYLLKALEIAEEIGSVELVTAEHEALSVLYEGIGDYPRSLIHFKEFTQLKDSLFNEEKNKELTRQELNYEFEKKEAEMRSEQEKKEAVEAEDKKRQSIFLALISAIALGIGIIAAVIFRSLKLTRKQKLIIEDQKEMVEQKQREVLDSIQYAKRIQSSLLPTEKYIAKNLTRLNKKT